MTPAHAARISRALDYPYDIPHDSFVLDRVGPRPMAPEDWRGLESRAPVVACGSNQSLAQLGRKFAGRLRAPLPVVKAVLKDYDTVYSAHFAGYGSLAATLCKSPDTEVSLAVTFLDDHQLEHMHATEALGMNYHFAPLADIHLTLADGTRLNDAHGYQSLWGGLNHDDAPVPLAEVPAQNRRFTARDQRQVQAMARDRLSPGQDIQGFILDNVGNGALRRARTQSLARGAVALE